MSTAGQTSAGTATVAAAITVVIIIVVIAMVVIVIVVLFLHHAKRSVTVTISGGTQSNGFGELASGIKSFLWIGIIKASNKCHDVNIICGYSVHLQEKMNGTCNFTVVISIPNKPLNIYCKSCISLLSPFLFNCSQTTIRMYFTCDIQLTMKTTLSPSAC